MADKKWPSATAMTPKSWVLRVGPGWLVCVAVAIVATLLGREVPLVGAPVLGIVLGIIMGALAHPGPGLRPGFALASGPTLKASIVVLGLTLSLTQLARVGLNSLPVMLGTLAIALSGAWILGRALGVRGDTQTLIGVGTAICGASAIAAATAVLKPKGSQVAYALGTIFTFNVIAVLTFPALGHAIGMSPRSFGLWAGTAINDTSSVVAAAYSFDATAGPDAIVVKLTRTLTLIPIVMLLAVIVARREALADETAPRFGWRTLPWRKLVPMFLLGFLLAAALNTLGLVPAATRPGITSLGTFLITIALAGIGLGLDLGDLKAAGVRPLLLGGALWVLVASSSLGLQAVTGTL